MLNVFKKLAIIFDVTLLPKSCWANRALLWQLVKRNVTIRYRGSMLGFLWSFIQPLMMLCVYTFVFSVVLEVPWKISGEFTKGEYAITMFCGITLYTIFTECVGGSCNVVSSNPNFVKKIIFPLEILPLAQCVSSFILGSVWLILLFLGVIFVFGQLSFTMLLIGLILLPLFFFALGISFLTASLSVYVRDTSYVVQVLLQILLFMTPIFYSIERVPERYRWPLEANPLTILIEQARNVFLYGKFPDWAFLGTAYLVSLLILHLGFIWFFKTKKGFADVL